MKSISLRFRIYLAILVMVLFLGTIGLMVIENFSLLDSFYFIIVTIATVGYGDIHPLSPAGKILVVGIILAGVGCFVGVVANAIEYMIDMRERTQRIEKLNMLIGVFYSEVGTKLLKNSARKIRRSRKSVQPFWSQTTGQKKISRQHLPDSKYIHTILTAVNSR